MKRTIWILLVVVLVGMLGWRILGKISQQKQLLVSAVQLQGKANEGSLTPVKTLKLTPHTIFDTLKLVGEIAPQGEVAVQSKVNGRLLEVMVDEGDFVEAGQLLAVLDDETLQIQLQQSEATWATAQANLHKAENELNRAQLERERYQALLEKKYVSQQDYEQIEDEYLAAQTTLATAKAQAVSAQKSYDLTKLQLNQTRIYALKSGYVLVSKAVAGENVNTATTLFSMAPLDQVKLKFSLDQREAGKAKQGTLVSFRTDAYPEEIFKGRITTAAPNYDTNTRTLSFTVLLDNSELKLIPGMFGSVEMIIKESKNALVVPQDAVLTQKDRLGVFVVDENSQAKFRLITPGITANLQTEIVAGLQVGDEVVIIGQNNLKEGTMVQAFNE